MKLSIKPITKDNTPMMYDNFLKELENKLDYESNVVEVKIFQTADFLFKGFLIVEKTWQ